MNDIKNAVSFEFKASLHKAKESKKIALLTGAAWKLMGKTVAEDKQFKKANSTPERIIGSLDA